jgi:hypothetical protein
MNPDFKNEVFSSFRPYSTRLCDQCGEKLAVVLTMLNPQNGRTVRMFKCKCGERTWSEDDK